MAVEPKNLDALRIDRSAERKRPRWPWVLVVVVVSAVTVAMVMPSLTGQRAVGVRTAIAREATLGGHRTVLNASGYVTARRQATVSSKVTGKVTVVLIEEGMEVAANQVLARLDNTNVNASLNLSKARQKSAEASLEETKVRIREAELEFGRVENLVARKVASQAELDRAQAELDSFRARLQSQHHQVTTAGREVAVWQQQLEDTVIRAPFSGIVVAKNAQPGEMISPVSAGGGFTRTGIGTIVDMASLEIEVDVNESYINRVEAGQAVTATLDAYSDWEIPCQVIAIVPTADRQKATVQVRIGFDQLDPRILPDMGVKVGFQDVAEETTRRSGVLVPSVALRHHNDRDVVLVIKDNLVQRRAVASEPGEGQETLIVSGLAAGETVVIEGPAELADGARVEEISS